MKDVSYRKVTTKSLKKVTRTKAYRIALPYFGYPQLQLKTISWLSLKIICFDISTYVISALTCNMIGSIKSNYNGNLSLNYSQ